jgi:hypothetical protein
MALTAYLRMQRTQCESDRGWDAARQACEERSTGSLLGSTGEHGRPAAESPST